MTILCPGRTDSIKLAQERERLSCIFPANSSFLLATKWRVAQIPTHGGLKLADSPPCYKSPRQSGFQDHSGRGTSPRLSRGSDARHYARHLMRCADNGAHSGRWSR